MNTKKIPPMIARLLCEELEKVALDNVESALKGKRGAKKKAEKAVALIESLVPSLGES